VTSRLPLSIFASLAILMLAGCSEPYTVAAVEGQLFIKGKPGNKIYLQFVPDPDQGTKGPSSTATTDDQGRFKLMLEEKNGKTRPGAVVGWHRVVLSDLQLAESATGRGLPIRLDQAWLLAATTPLKQEVKPGEQTLELKFP
jgi:hypothetical protein